MAWWERPLSSFIINMEIFFFVGVEWFNATLAYIQWQIEKKLGRRSATKEYLSSMFSIEMDLM